MADENFLLVSLKEDDAKKLAQVISNDTSRKILDYLAHKKDDTESGIAKKLKLPISTVHYNLQALVKAKLVQADEFHYSEKGKEVNHYSLANKYVIIAPKNAPESLKSKLRRILPVALLAGAGALVLKMFSLWNTGIESFDKAKTVAPMARTFEESEAGVAKSVADYADEAMAEPAMQAVNTVQQNVTDTIQCGAQAIAAECSKPHFLDGSALWFFLGAVFAIIIFLLIELMHKKK